MYFISVSEMLKMKLVSISWISLYWEGERESGVLKIVIYNKCNKCLFHLFFLIYYILTNILLKIVTYDKCNKCLFHLFFLIYNILTKILKIVSFEIFFKSVKSCSVLGKKNCI